MPEVATGVAVAAAVHHVMKYDEDARLARNYTWRVEARRIATASVFEADTVIEDFCDFDSECNCHVFRSQLPVPLAPRPVRIPRESWVLGALEVIMDLQTRPGRQLTRV